MSWTILRFGQHIGETLPQVLLSNPDWFFWAMRNIEFYGQLEEETADLDYKARRIKICRRHPQNWQIEYRYENNRRFLGFWIVEASDSPYIGKGRVRSDWLDFSCIRRGRTYDKAGGRNLIRDVKKHYFGGRSLTKRRCERFFEDERNFV